MGSVSLPITTRGLYACAFCAFCPLRSAKRNGATLTPTKLIVLCSSALAVLGGVLRSASPSPGSRVLLSAAVLVSFVKRSRSVLCTLDKRNTLRFVPFCERGAFYKFVPFAFHCSAKPSGSSCFTPRG